MAKRTRFRYQAANQMGTHKTITASTALTEANILQEGNQFIKSTNGNAILTLPAASENLKGILIRFFTTKGGTAYVSGGFGGGGASYDSIAYTAYQTADFWCDGSYWYALGVAVTSAGSSSSSSSSSSSESSSSSSESSSSSSSSSSSESSSSSSSVSQ